MTHTCTDMLAANIVAQTTHVNVVWLKRAVVKPVFLRVVKLARHSLWQAAVFGEFGVSLLLEAYNV